MMFFIGQIRQARVNKRDSTLVNRLHISLQYIGEMSAGAGFVGRRGSYVYFVYWRV